MSKTNQVGEALGLQIIARLRGSEQLPVSGDLQDGVYLVEKDGKRFVLKTGNFNKNEVADNKLLSGLGIKAQQIIDSKDGEYILYEYLDAPLLAKEEFWSDENIKRVFVLHDKIRGALKDQVPDAEARRVAGEWMISRVDKEWLPTLVPEVLSEETAKMITNFYHRKSAEGVSLGLVYKDNNPEHYVDLGNELAVLDADLAFRPKEYMNMRYLSWVLLKTPSDKLGDSVVWAKKWADYLGAGEEHFATWLLSLVGILWDIHGNEKSKGQNIEKTEDIKQVLDWVIEKLNLQK